MKRCVKLLSLPFFLLLSQATIFTGCNSASDTTILEWEEVPISIEPCLKADPTSLISFEELSLETGSLDRNYTNPWAGEFQRGEPCFLINGTIRNEYNEGYWVAYHALGYDDSGNIVSHTLDEGPILGLAQLYIEADSTQEFTLHMS
jgi:hypothetical protein